MINQYLKYLPYKIKDDNFSYYLTITKCYKGYRIMYWDFDKNVKIKQLDNTLVGSLRKTVDAFNILKELKEIK